jgi:hypothetical protein
VYATMCYDTQLLYLGKYTPLRKQNGGKLRETSSGLWPCSMQWPAHQFGIISPLESVKVETKHCTVIIQTAPQSQLQSCQVSSSPPQHGGSTSPAAAKSSNPPPNVTSETILAMAPYSCPRKPAPPLPAMQPS